MKKIVSIISIFAIILSATQFVLADYSDDTTITDGQFAYKKGTNNILAYVGTTGICEIPENTTLKGLTPSWAKDAAPITKLIINDNVDINMIISGELVNLNINDLNFEDRSCIVLGKGNKEREVYFDAKTKLHLKEYIDKRNDSNDA